MPLTHFKRNLCESKICMNIVNASLLIIRRKFNRISLKMRLFLFSRIFFRKHLILNTFNLVFKEKSLKIIFADI